MKSQIQHLCQWMVRLTTIKHRAVLVFILAATWLLPVVVRAQFDTEVVNGTVTIERYLGSDVAVTIPDTIDNLPVTSIGEFAFGDCTNMMSVSIPGSVTNIGEYAFVECVSLTNVAIPDSVTSVGDLAFFECSNLTAVAIGDGVTNLGDNTFNFCSSLMTVSLTNGLKIIGEGDFFQCLSLTNITIPDSVTCIGTNAFEGCTNLPEINIPDSVTNIEDSAFFYCASLTNVIISNAVTSIGAEAFAESGLTDVSFLDRVPSIGEEAFDGCIGLINVTIPDNVTNIGENPFEYCENLVAISVDPGNPSYSSMAGVLFNKNQTLLIQFPLGEPTLNYAIPDTVNIIESGAFQGCYTQTNIFIPDSVMNIEEYSFEYDESVTSLTVDPQNTFYSSVDGILFNKNQTILVQFPTGKPVAGYALPPTVVSIEAGAFQGCSLTSLDITNAITSIGDYVFSDCASLTNLMLPDTVTNIGAEAFLGCTSLTEMTIPSNVISIGFGAFDDCTNLTAVYFQGNAPTIEGEIFNNINALPEAFYSDPATAYYLPNTTGWATFATNSGLPAVEFTGPQIGSGSASVQAGESGFGFNIIGYPSESVTVEASTNLVNWQPIQTVVLPGISTNFADAQWKNYPARFYRVQ
jgi:hypothetical protein